MNPAVITRARKVLSDKRYEVWHDRHVDHLSLDAIMYRRNIHKSTVRDRLAAAHLELLRAGVRQTGSGTYYLEENHAA